MKEKKKQTKKVPEAPKVRNKTNEQELQVPLHRGSGGKRIYPIG
jgi:hypothetical protein